MKGRLLAATMAASALLALPAAAQAGVTITWSQEALRATADGSGTDVILSTREYVFPDNSRERFPAFNVTTGTASYDTQHCLVDFGYILCDWADRTQLIGGSANDRFSIFEGFDGFPAGEPVDLFGNGGDDQLTDASDGSSRLLEGGDGNDKLLGYGGDDTLRGGNGNDEVDGAAGKDIVEGGDGNDTLYGDHFEAPSADVIDGGPGLDKVSDWDVVSGGERPAVAVSVDGVANDGRPGENDNLVNVEHIEGPYGTFIGSDGPEKFVAGESGQTTSIQGRGGDDDITTNNGVDTIDGGAGADTITAGFANDTITGGAGRDTIYADATSSYCGFYSCTLPFGNDVVNAVDGEVDSIDCGPGNDEANVDASDVTSNCERVNVSSGGGAGGGGAGGGGGGGAGDVAMVVKVLTKLSIRTIAARGLTFQLPCPAACTVRAKVIADKATARKLKLGRSRQLAKGSKSLLAAGTAKLTVKVPRKVKARFRRLRKATLTLKVTVTGADGKTTALPAKVLRLRR